LSSQEIIIDIDEILGDTKPEFIPIINCQTGTSQARQTNTKVDKDSKLVASIKKAGGLLHPIIVKSQSDGTYEIIVGQRRAGAYTLLKEENPKFEKIKAYVIDRDLSEDEKKIISFIENFGRDDMEKLDYINVIEYFYQKYGMNKTMTANALGIRTSDVTEYLTHARLSEKVKACIENKEFTIDVAMKSLKGLGDDETSVDEGLLIETAKELAKVRPALRKKAVQKMQKEGISAKEAVKTSVSTMEIRIDVTEDQLDRVNKYKTKHGYENKEESAVEAMDVELMRDISESE
jgi:ParB/RepB/Spo0J family partition protein